MLMAKALVFGTMLILAAEVVAFGSFFAGSALLHSKVPVALSDPGVTRAVIGAGLYLAVLGVFALAIGGLIRHTAGGIAAVIGVVLVLPIQAAGRGEADDQFDGAQDGPGVHEAHCSPDRPGAGGRCPIGVTVTVTTASGSSLSVPPPTVERWV